MLETSDRPSNRDDIVDLTVKPEVWMACTASPVSGLELLPCGRFRIAGRTYGPCDPVCVLIGRIWIDKLLGDGLAIRLRTEFGESAIRYQGEEWLRLVFPPDMDPLDRLASAPPAARHITISAGVSQATSSHQAVHGSDPTTQTGELQNGNLNSWSWWVRTSKTIIVTIITLIATIVLSLRAISEPDGATAKWRLTVADLSADPDHRWISHVAVNPSYSTLLLWAVGLFVFGVCVERSCGTLRTLIVILAGAFCGVLMQTLIHTPAGQEALAEELAKLYWQIAHNRGLDAADKFAEVVGWLILKCQQSSLVAGSAGVVGALIAYAAVRRDITDDGLAIRPFKFLLAACYVVVLVEWAWPQWVGEAFPYGMFVGGFLGGIGVIFPDKVLGWVWEKVKERIQEYWTP